jgi:hypothetical protein
VQSQYLSQTTEQCIGWSRYFPAEAFADDFPYLPQIASLRGYFAVQAPSLLQVHPEKSIAAYVDFQELAAASVFGGGGGGHSQATAHPNPTPPTTQTSSIAADIREQPTIVLTCMGLAMYQALHDVYANEHQLGEPLYGSLPSSPTCPNNHQLGEPLYGSLPSSPTCPNNHQLDEPLYGSLLLVVGKIISALLSCWFAQLLLGLTFQACGASRVRQWSSSNMPRRCLPSLTVITMHVYMYRPDLTPLLPHVTIRLVNYEPLTALKSLKASSIGKYISLKGTIVRVGNVKPLVHGARFWTKIHTRGCYIGSSHDCWLEASMCVVQ